MKKTWKYIVGILGFAGLLYYGSSALEALNAPSLPPETEQFKLHFNRIDAIVDEQWSRDGAVPTASDLRAFQDLIDELNKVDYAPLKQAHDRAISMEAAAQKLWVQRSSAYLTTYYRLEHYLGEDASRVMTEIVHRPALDAADYSNSQVKNLRMVSSAMISLRPNVRYHLAMALIFARDDKGAIEQMKLMLKENPDYSHSGIPYFIAVRAHAANDLDFRAALEAAGGNVEIFQRDYMGEELPLLPSFGNARHARR